MNKKDSFRKGFILELIIVFILIIMGIVMIIRTFNEYGEIFVENQDLQLQHLAEVVDLNVDATLEKCKSTLEYVTQRRGFLDAEEIWKSTRDTQELRFRMEENLLVQDEMISAMVAFNGYSIFLSTNTEHTYHMMDGVGNDKIRYCIDEEDNMYLAFVHKAENNLKYAALMDVDTFYYQIAGSKLAKNDWIILIDRDSEIVMYQQNGNFRVERIDELSSDDFEQNGINILVNQQKKQEKDSSYFEHIDCYDEENYIARMISLPTDDTENKEFAIGVVTNFEKVMSPLHIAVVQVLCFGLMIIVGILLLLHIVIRYKRRNDKNLEELELLREKNAIMEEVNRKTREFAHHQRLETIGTLTAGIAHEFNNLLTPIMGYSMMTLEQLPPEMEEVYDNILEVYNASLKAKDITSRLSELSRKNLPTSFTNVSLKEINRKVKHVARPVRPAQVTIIEEIDEADCIVIGNETQLSQMVLNLVLNAFHAMEKEGGTLTISIYEEDEKVILKIKDTGKGISDEIKEKMFEPFFTTKESGKGTGLGLPIVQQIVNEHHGKIWVESEILKGTNVTIELPCRNNKDKMEENV